MTNKGYWDDRGFKVEPGYVGDKRCWRISRYDIDRSLIYKDDILPEEIIPILQSIEREDKIDNILRD